MEQDFQTSFIPKKPMIEDRTVTPRPVSLLTVLTMFVFFTMLVTTGALYFYKQVLEKNITQMASDLNLAQNRFEPDKIAQLQQLDKRLKAATEVLSNHIAVSPIFIALESLTLKTVSYTKFDYELGDTAGAPITVNMSGIAVGYRSIALQADLFSTNAKYIIDPVFSNLSLDDKGNVLFDLQFSVDPSFVNYEQLLETNATAAAAATAQGDTSDTANTNATPPLAPDGTTPVTAVPDTTTTLGATTTTTPPVSTTAGQGAPVASTTPPTATTTPPAGAPNTTTN